MASKASEKIRAVAHEQLERHRSRKWGKGPQLGQAQTLGMPGGATLPVSRGTQGTEIGKRAARESAKREKVAKKGDRVAATMNVMGGGFIITGAAMAGSGFGAVPGAIIATGGASMAVTGSVHAMRAQQQGEIARNVRNRGRGLDYQITATKQGRNIKDDGAAFTRAQAEFAARRDAAAADVKTAGDTFERTRRDPRSGKIIHETVRKRGTATGATKAAIDKMAGKGAK